MAEPNFNYPGEGITSSVQDGKTYDFTGVYTDGVTYYISKAAIESRNDGGEITDWDVSTPYGGEYSIEDSYIAYSPEGFMAGWETVAFDLTVENLTVILDDFTDKACTSELETKIINEVKE